MHSWSVSTTAGEGHQQQIRQLAATHPRHHQIGDQQVDAPIMELGTAQPFLTALGVDHGITTGEQNRPRARADRRLVLHHQHRL